MASRVRTPSPGATGAADARRQRYAQAHESAQRGKGDARTPSHTYDVERGSVQNSPPRPQHFSLDVDDGSGFAMGPTVPQPPVGMQPGAGMFYQAQQAAMMQQGLYRTPGTAQFSLGQGSMSCAPAFTSVDMATAGLGGAMYGPCGPVRAQAAFYPPNGPGGCVFPSSQTGLSPPNVPGGCVFQSGQEGQVRPAGSGQTGNSVFLAQQGQGLGPVVPVGGQEGQRPAGGGSAPVGAVGPEGVSRQEADVDSLDNVSTPQGLPGGHDVASQQRFAAGTGVSNGAREESPPFAQLGASGQADLATMMALLHSQGEALRSCIAEVANLGRRVEQLALGRGQPTHEVGAGGSVGKLTDASSNFGARVAPPHGQNFYGTPARAKPEKEEQDVFTKSEKWLPALPSPQYDGWKNREQEILGFNEYLTTLKGWVALGSDTFPIEIEQAIKWPHEIFQASLTKPQAQRSNRLFAILRQAFAGHARADMILRSYIEGAAYGENLQRSSGDTCGFEALRLLGHEFSLRCRAEASYFRAEFIKRSFRGESAATHVSDIVRKVDVELSRYKRLVETLPSTVSRDGLEVGSSDLTLMLLRSISKDARSYCLLHATGESYQELRKAALRYESQQRMFAEMGLNDRQERYVNELDDPTAEWWEEDEWYEEDSIHSVSAAKCRRCGKTGHIEKDCKTDLSKVQCFNCHQYGHIGARCPKPKAKAKPSSEASSQSGGKATETNSAGKGSGKGPKGHGKGKGPKGRGRSGKGGKKGKMHELTEDVEGEEVADDAGIYEAGDYEAEEAAEANSLLVMPVLLNEESVQVPTTSLLGHSSEGTMRSYTSFFNALMVSQVDTDDSWSWWLLDSGASVTVMAAHFEGYYALSHIKNAQKGSFSATNGSAVDMQKHARATVAFETVKSLDSEQTVATKFVLNCFVGKTRHNIMSVPQLMENGWEIHFVNDGCYLKHHTGVIICEIAWYCGCPWLRAVAVAEGTASPKGPRDQGFPLC